MLSFWEKIAIKCPYKRCGDTQDFIASVFQHEIEDSDLNKEIKKYNIPVSKPEQTVSKQYYSPINVEKIIHEMKLNSSMNGRLFVDIDIGNLEHAFILFEINECLFVIDSYVNYRKCEIREFSYQYFSDLLINPSTDKWNKLFNCQEKLMLNDSEIWITYIYENENLGQQQFFRNDIMIPF